MKKILVLATAMTLVGGVAALAAPGDTWFGSSYGVSKGNGHGYAYGLSKRNNRATKNRVVRRGVDNCVFSCGNGGGSNGSIDNHGGPTAVVPVPAAGFLLIAGLGAFAVTKRRKK